MGIGLQPRLKVLVVLPKPSDRAGDGDNIVHRRVIDRLSAEMDVSVVSLQTTGKVGRLLNLFGAVPPEVARHVSPRNKEIVTNGLHAHRPDVICLFNETTFPVAPIAKAPGLGVVLYPHNVHSRIADTDAALSSHLFRGSTRAFERRFYGDPAVELVCISEADSRYLARAGVRASAPVASPGAPPAKPLAPDAAVEPALVITGSYGWWRKRRDLVRYGHEPGIADPASPAVRYYASPAATAEVDLAGARPIEGLDWGAAVRFGVITDRFAGGFKLKATEYVALNCIVLTFADISEEFEGLPHAAEFVRTVGSRREAETIACTMAASDPGLVARFVDFKQACLARFDWSRTLDPMIVAVQNAARTRAA